MGLESANWVGDLVITNPTVTDQKQFGDDHLRMLKSVLKKSFNGFFGQILAYATEAQGATVNDYVLTLTDTLSAYTSPSIYVFNATHTNTSACTLKIGSLTAKGLLNVDKSGLDAGAIVNGAAVIVLYDGSDFILLSGNDRANRGGDSYLNTHDFTGAVINVPTQTQGDGTTKAASTLYVDTGLALKANLDSPIFTGVPRGPSASFGASGTQLATLDFVNGTVLAGNLPGQTGAHQKVMTSVNETATWQAIQGRRFFVGQS